MSSYGRNTQFDRVLGWCWIIKKLYTQTAKNLSKPQKIRVSFFLLLMFSFLFAKLQKFTFWFWKRRTTDQLLWILREKFSQPPVSRLKYILAVFEHEQSGSITVWGYVRKWFIAWESTMPIDYTHEAIGTRLGETLRGDRAREKKDRPLTHSIR